MRVIASVARSIAASLRWPASSSPAPSRGAAFISPTTRIFPSGATSATICRIEFDPMSIAATRSCPVSGAPPERRATDSAVADAMR